MNIVPDGSAMSQLAINADRSMGLPLYPVNKWEDYTKIFLEPNNEIILPNVNHTDFGTQLDFRWSPNGFEGFGFNSPTHNIASDFQMLNGKRIDEEDSDYNPENPYLNRDPRFYADIVYNGCFYRGREIETFFPKGMDSADSEVGQQVGASKSGYYIRKFMDESIDISSERGDQPYPIFRLAEIYLNYAEAQYHLNNEDIAREYINKVRK